MRDPRGYLRPEEIKKIVEVCKTLKELAVIETLRRTGIRVSELLSIRRDSISWDEKTLLIRWLKHEKKGNKNNVTPLMRQVYIDNKLIEILQRFVEKYAITNYLFPVTRQAIFKMVRSIGRRAHILTVGSKKIHPHHFRHSFVVNALKKGVKIETIQKLVGHKDISTTAHYLQFSSEELKEAVEKIWSDE